MIFGFNMGKLRIVSVLVLLLIVVSIGLVYFQINKNDLNSNITSNEPSVMEFPALTLCRQTGGDWTAVDSAEFLINPEEGVYNPTTNPKINYKCFCPQNKKWNVEGGCK